MSALVVQLGVIVGGFALADVLIGAVIRWIAQGPAPIDVVVRRGDWG